MIGINYSYESILFSFRENSDEYDGKDLSYLYAEIDADKLQFLGFEIPEVIITKNAPNFILERTIRSNAYDLFEMITNYHHRHLWVDGVEEFKFNENEVTRSGSEHVCVINGKHFNFTTIIKKVPVHQLIYGELTTDLPPVDKLYQFYIIEQIDETKSLLRVEQYWETKNLFQKVLMVLVGQKRFKKKVISSIDKLQHLVPY